MEQIDIGISFSILQHFNNKYLPGRALGRVASFLTSFFSSGIFSRSHVTQETLMFSELLLVLEMALRVSVPGRDRSKGVDMGNFSAQSWSGDQPCGLYVNSKLVELILESDILKQWIWNASIIACHNLVIFSYKQLNVPNTYAHKVGNLLRFLASSLDATRSITWTRNNQKITSYFHFS